MSNEPREYAEGWTEFLGCKIDLSHRPLIPRPETEFWVEKLINNLKHPASKGQLISALDLFSGSGCVGIAVLKHCPNTHVTFGELELSTLEQIKINCKLNNLISTTYQLIPTNFFSKISSKFDFILANPPYVAEGKGVEGIMNHESPKALYAGTEGLDVIKPFLEQAREHLNPGGQIWMEFGSEQKEAVTNILRLFDYYQNFSCTFHRDQHNRWRYVVTTL